MAKALTSEEISFICDTLRSKDLKYAQSLDEIQGKFLKSNPRIKSFQDFKIVHEIKQALIAVHTAPGSLHEEPFALGAIEKETVQRLKTIKQEGLKH